MQVSADGEPSAAVSVGSIATSADNVEAGLIDRNENPKEAAV